MFTVTMIFIFQITMITIMMVYCCLYDCPLTNIDIIGDNENFLPYTDQKRYIFCYLDDPDRGRSMNGDNLLLK